MSDQVFISRIVLKNYMSISGCNVQLKPLTFLVGQNGAGKSNFLNAIRLVSESLTTSLDHALRERGGISEVRRRSSGHPTHFGIRLEFFLDDGTPGYYSFKIGAKQNAGFEVQQEECQLFSKFQKPRAFFQVESGKLESKSEKIMPPATTDRLYLVAAAGLPEFRPIYDSLSHMGFYNLNPDEIRDLQAPDAGDVLMRDGRNIASVLSNMEKEDLNSKKLVVNFLSKVVPGITDVYVKHIGNKETIEFRQKVGANKSSWRFMAENMSDGTLRALGILVALFQSKKTNKIRVPFVGIEEPEIALHPGAAGVLRNALISASANTQILVTSHSPDLLDDKKISDENILAVENVNGATLIAPLSLATRKAIKNKLYTAGELLRLNQLSPENNIKIRAEQLELFKKTLE
jgi:predicted ATPase